MRAAVRGLYLDVGPRGQSDDPAEFAFLARLIVGPDDGPGEESFDVEVCSPEWLRRRCSQEQFVDGRHMVITTLEAYSELGLRSFLTRRVEQASGATWEEVAQQVARLGSWEFEDYSP